MSDPIRRIPVSTSPPYTVSIGGGLLGRCGSLLAEAVPAPCRVAVITDSAVGPLYLETVQESLKGAGYDTIPYVFPAGEGSKNIETLSGILEFLAEERLTRTDCVAALGGGVTGDMAGFAAACYLRGIRCVQLPTTLLSAVDSSVGGKTAIDLQAGKNLAGAFLQPAAVLCDTDCLKTLPPDVFADGAAEAIKTGVLCDESLFGLFENGGLAAEPAEVIARCVAYKAGVVERDEREQGERRLLNLGHAAAIRFPTATPWRRGWLSSPGPPKRWAGRKSLWPGGLPGAWSKTASPPGRRSRRRPWPGRPLPDKKRAGGDITLVIPKRIGLCALKKIPVGQLPAVIRAGLEG